MLENLETYLVGGAVRDQMLGRAISDRDWVVVGATVEQMIDVGFVQVGKDFPVFLHPVSKEEYALARTERKSGQGHQGFAVFASPDVTLEQDLARRDLTINAMALDEHDVLFDPFNGKQDLEQRILRHVSAAFTEDPLRVFRVARFAAQLSGFSVAAETMDLMKTMCASGALQELSAERIWQETEKALAALKPQKYFQILELLDALDDWFVELKNRPLEFDLGDSHSRFAQLGLAPEPLRAFAERLKVPNSFQQLAQDRWTFGQSLMGWQTLNSDDLAELLTGLQTHHSNARLDSLAAALGLDDLDQLHALAAAFRKVKLGDDIPPGPAYGTALKAARVAALKTARLS